MTKATNPVESVRRFNRFYTSRARLIRDDYLGSSHTLAEARVIYELGVRKTATASDLGRDMHLDLGYLSRLLQGLKRRGVLQGKRSAEDARRTVLALTPKGHKAFLGLDARSRKEIGDVLSGLSTSDRSSLLSAMSTVQGILGDEKPAPRISLREHRPGDLGWVVQAHGRLYFEEFGWDERFEALVAGIVSGFVKTFDPARERVWIAERDGEPVGSIFCVKAGARTAKLRLLLVDRKARNGGLGKRLTAECIAFARAKGYRKLVLWTQSNLAAARHIYQAAGFRLTKEYRHREFGYDLTGEYWQLNL